MTTLLMNTVTLVFIFTEKVQRLHSHFSSFYERKLIMHVEYGHAIFGKHSSSARRAVENATSC